MKPCLEALALLLASLSVAINARQLQVKVPHGNGSHLRSVNAYVAKLAEEADHSSSDLDVDFMSSNCSSCDVVVDMQCFHRYKNAFYHAIHDCLVPQYGAVEFARARSGLRCFIANGQMAKVLQPLVADLPNRIIDPKANCTAKLKAVGVNKTGFWRWTLPDDYEVRVVVQRDPPLDLRALQRDAARLAPRPRDPALILGGAGVGSRGPSSYLVLLQRLNTRTFTTQTEQLLANRLADITGLSVKTYTGDLSQAETILLFRDAVGVIGYHGAGFINTYFSSHPVCVLEITTFEDKDYSDKTLWRSNAHLAESDPLLNWTTYALSLRDLVDVNNELDTPINTSKFESDADHAIKELQYVGLWAPDVEELAVSMKQCIFSLFMTSGQTS